MNRSILIVICDFLLVSLLVFATPDASKLTNPDAHQKPSPQGLAKLSPSTNVVDRALGAALADERRVREQLNAQLTERERQMLAVRQQLQTREQETARLQQEQTNLVVGFQEQLRTRQMEAARVQQEATNLIRQFQQELVAREAQSERLQAEQTNLLRQFVSAQTNLQGLSEQLRNTATASVLSREKIAAMEAEMRKQTEQAAALQQQLAELARSNQLALAEKQELNSQLYRVEAERRAATNQVAWMQDIVKTERAERSQLTEKLGSQIGTLANKSGELAQEVRENRPLASNVIFNDFMTNRVMTHFDAFRPTLLGIGSNQRRDTESVLVTDGTNTFALCHVQDTPLVLWNPGTEWQTLTGTLSHYKSQLPIHSLRFCLRDPRVVLIPVDAAETRQLACRVYRASSAPYKFEDAVLVGAREGYYGECRFQIDIATPGYVKLDRSVLKGLFGKFNPSSGDLVFSRTGELLGVMANDSYCMVLDNFYSAAGFRLGNDVRDQHTGSTLSAMYSMVMEMPSRLQ